MLTLRSWSLACQSLCVLMVEQLLMNRQPSGPDPFKNVRMHVVAELSSNVAYEFRVAAVCVRHTHCSQSVPRNLACHERHWRP